MSTLLLILMIALPAAAFAAGVWLGRRHSELPNDEQQLTVEEACRKLDLACAGCGDPDACCALEALRLSGASVSKRIYHRFQDGGHELHLIVDPSPEVRS